MEYTIADIEELTKKKVVEIKIENRWVVITLDTGIRIRIKNWKTA
jgi:hypothetical protein